MIRYHINAKVWPLGQPHYCARCAAETDYETSCCGRCAQRDWEAEIADYAQRHAAHGGEFPYEPGLYHCPHCRRHAPTARKAAHRGALVEQWWQFSAYNETHLFGWGTKPEAHAYLLNSEMYDFVDVDAAVAEELSAHPELGVNLAEALAAIAVDQE